MRGTDYARWLGIGGIAFAVLAFAASGIEVSRERKGSVPPAPAVAPRDPFAIELERCNAIKPTSGRDEACERVWAENRRRFLGSSRQTFPAPAPAPAAQPAVTGDRP